MATTREKLLGQFFTPEEVAANLINWALPAGKGRALDPSCGDGEFLRRLEGAVGVELCAENVARAREAAPDANVVEADFFEWAATRGPSFDAVVGNPPFIRYQQFNGSTRKQALRLSKRIGVELNGLTSSWAPFIAVSASLLNPGGRMAFVVPAEIGHATYAEPLMEGLCRNFSSVTVVALREKVFPHLSQDAWLLYAGGRGGSTEEIGFTALRSFSPGVDPDNPRKKVPIGTWREMGGRLRKFLIPNSALEMYRGMTGRTGVSRLEDIANVSIGYVSGDNDFFHFHRSAASMFEIPEQCLRPTIRRGEQLTADYVDDRLIERWTGAGEEIWVLDLSDVQDLPQSVRNYLNSPRAERAQERYKCRVRDPWYVIPGVDQAPSAFVTCMSGRESRLSINRAGAVCTNSVLAVTLKRRVAQTELLGGWRHPLARLSQELEGHPLGGGMLKLEPGEARRVYLPLKQFRAMRSEERAVAEAIELMRTWRHYGPDADRG
ncbi:MAG: Eco57I restriction-modification methylase domain-containing protein [Armatimonadota bacterium]